MTHSLLLVLAAFIWGMAFVSQSKGMDFMHPLTFNGVRALIGAFALLIYIVVSRKIAGSKAKNYCGKPASQARLRGASNQRAFAFGRFGRGDAEGFPAWDYTRVYGRHGDNHSLGNCGDNAFPLKAPFPLQQLKRGDCERTPPRRRNGVLV